jgi:diaminopimelate decarboxylase
MSVELSAKQRVERRERAVAEACRRGLIGEQAPVAAFVDLRGIEEAVGDLRDAFAGFGTVRHAAAVKACPLVPVLRLLDSLGVGAEVASPGELAVARAAGIPPERTVFDSPAKTVGELREALRSGIAVNADNEQELARLDELVGPNPPTIGARINPQIGKGGIGSTSTATDHSKFGIGLADPGVRERLVELVARRPWLTRLHVHVGSQGCPLELLVRGVSAVVELAEEIEQRVGQQRITSLDIGGGLPVNFDSEQVSPTCAEYARMLAREVPGLDRYALVTEFGRSLLAKNGFFASTVEYAKVTGGRPIAVTHAGAQVAARTALQPADWPLRLGAFDRRGRPKVAPEVAQDVAGPACFAGDLLAENRQLPELERGDVVAAYDTGAYYFTAHYGYNSLLRPAVHGFSVSGNEIEFATIREPQSVEELVRDSGGANADALLELR